MVKLGIDTDIDQSKHAEIIRRVTFNIGLIPYAPKDATISILTRENKIKFLKEINSYDGVDDNSLSYAFKNQQFIVIDYHNWQHGHTRVTQGTPEQYQLYVLAHELGHLAGKDHDPLPGPGKLVTIMYQATLGVPHDRIYDPIRAIAHELKYPTKNLLK
jgi:hypothetical protein